MKKQLLVLLFLGVLGSSITINNGPKILLTDQQVLQCDGAVGNVIFSAPQLPTGVTLQNNTLTISNREEVNNGNYYIILHAQDQNGNSAEQIIVLTIQISESQPISLNTDSNHQQQSQFNATEPDNDNTENIGENIGLDPKVIQLLDSLQISRVYESSDYSQGYPTVQFPLGNNDAINSQAYLIRSSQAAPSQSNRNTITEDDVRGNGIFMRQFNAAKALANLLSIIKEAKANLQAAQLEVEKRAQILNEANQIQNEAAIKIQQADIQVQKIRQGMSILNEQIAQIRTQIQQLIASRNSKELQKQALQVSITNLNQAISQLRPKIDQQRSKSQQIQVQISEKEQQCDAYTEQFSSAQESIRINQINRQKLQGQVQQKNTEASQKVQQINQLKKRLMQAQNDLENIRGDITNLQNQISETVIETDMLKNRLNDLDQRRRKCIQDKESILTRLSGLQETINALQQQQQQIKQELQKLKAELTQTQATLSQIPQMIQQQQLAQKQASQKLSYLKNQLIILQTALRLAYVEGSAAKQAVKMAEQSLQSAISRVQGAQQTIDSATLNLQRARVEKDQADFAVQQYLKEGAQLLPYAAAPEDYGVEIDNSTNSYRIDSWQGFINTAYGPTIKPLFVGSLSNLFSFNVQAKADKPQEQGQSQCPQTDLVAMSGYVVNVKENIVQLIDNTDGKIYKAEIFDCTLTLANTEDYEMESGDIIILKGGRPQQNTIQATQIACIQNK